MTNTVTSPSAPGNRTSRLSLQDAARINAQLEGASAAEVLAWAAAQHGDRLAIATSFGAEDMVLMDLVMEAAPAARFFTLDTGRLPEETYAVMEAARDRWGVTVEVFSPDTASVEALVAERGVNLFYRSVEDRKACCHVRKVLPLRRALRDAEAWATGLRREQAVTRTALPHLQIDYAHGGIAKLNPLANWSQDDVWAHIRSRGLPYNALHDRGYPSIGCAPCTRAIRPGEDIRAGRWWWETPESRECGLHVSPPVGAGRASEETEPAQL